MLYTQREVNLHTHSFYCGHGAGEIADFVEEARRTGIKVLGFSEHCPVPGDRWHDSRMYLKDFPHYMDDVRKAKQNPYGIKVLLGAECDWDRQYLSYYREELLGKQKFDYLLGSVHYFRDNADGKEKYIGLCGNFMPYLDKYAASYLEMLESGLFIIGCHPDLFAYHTPWNPEFDRVSDEIIACALANNIPLEINGQGTRKSQTDPDGTVRYPYPVRQFWEKARDAGVRICCNSDGHEPRFLYEQKCFDFAYMLGIKFIDWNF